MAHLLDDLFAHVSWEGLERRFHTKVAQQASGCWLWTGATQGHYNKLGSKTEAPYGCLVVRVGPRPDNKTVKVLAHRLAWYVAHQTDPGDALLLHSCDTRLCVNPAHLRIGTHQENMTEMVARGRSTAGSRNGRAKLTESDVLDILQMSSLGQSLQEIAAVFGVTNVSIRNAIVGKTFPHVERTT